ncbi:uncharacterized protein [Dermacentor albipictus]|uniref:uncharacterized protein isoform X3 n=1 Tax=Dermacentor albipictus TaxID=60249 RepID=UPI0038FD2BC5
MSQPTSLPGGSSRMRMAVADRPRTPCAGPAPMLHRTVLGVGASLGTVEPPVAHGQELQELEKLRAELIMERRKNAALTARVSELESSLSSSEAQTVSARALSDSLLQELQYAAQQVATLGQSD